MNSFDALRARVEYPAAWRPDPGESLVGEAVGWSEYSKVDPASGETRECQILVVRDEAGVEHGVWCWHSILRQ